MSANLLKRCQLLKGMRYGNLHPLRVAERLFSNSGLTPKPDADLADLIMPVLACMPEERLTEFLKRYERFDGAVTVMGINQRVEHYYLRDTLKELPRYVSAGQAAGLSPEQTRQLLLHTLDTDPYEFNSVNIHVLLLARALEKSALPQTNIPGNLETLLNLIRLSAEEGVLDSSLFSFAHAVALGLSVDQASRVIGRLPDADGSLCGYVVGKFNDALGSLKFSDVDPALVVDVFDILGGKRPYFQSHEYTMFHWAVALLVPDSGMTPNQFLELFATHPPHKEGAEAVLRGMKGSIPEGYSKKAAPDAYFKRIQGPLEHATLPYQTQRSFHAGMSDLQQMAVARSHRWEDVGEGYWIFAPETETWYSLGGILEVRPGKLRHNFLSYDISRLSKRPFLVHIHPKDLDIMVAPQRESLTYPWLQDDATQFLTSTPSRADYSVVSSMVRDAGNRVHPRNFIVHSQGITEFPVPKEIGQIDHMAVVFRDLRDKAMLEFDIESYLRQNHHAPGQLVKKLVTHLNTLIAPEFRFKMYVTSDAISP